MKAIICRDVLIGEENTEKLSSSQMKKWKERRFQKLENLIDGATGSGISFLCLLGKTFSNGSLEERNVDRLFEVVKSEASLQVFTVLEYSDFKRLNYRDDFPENFHILCLGASNDAHESKGFRVEVSRSAVELSFNDKNLINIEIDEDDIECLINKKKVDIPFFEPLGFEDNRNGQFGHTLIEFDEHDLKWRNVNSAVYTYQEAELPIAPTDSFKDVSERISRIIPKLENDTFFRFTLKGISRFGMTFNVSALKDMLQKKVFYAEVFDNTVMEVDAADFEHDISLKSEFVRLALQDETLSETERNRLISCGWNALNGKEVDAE